MTTDLSISPMRVMALVRREFTDLRTSRVLLVPSSLCLLFLALPFIVIVVAPSTAGDGLADSDTTRMMRLALDGWPALAMLPADAAVEAFLFQQFLLMVVLGPVTGAMSIAAHGIISEKQARTLEPLLATPLTTADLLMAKTLAAFVPALAMLAASLGLYAVGIAIFGAPGVLAALVDGRTAMVVLGIGPLSALIGLQLTVIMSSRVNDARSAQQIGTLVVVPLVALMVVQGLGLAWASLGMLAALAAGLALVSALLVVAGISLFNRERVLTRWR